MCYASQVYEVKPKEGSMSKASDYADRLRAAAMSLPPELESREGVSMARVNAAGHLFLGAGTFMAADALRLRDWLTENFSEHPTPPDYASTEIFRCPYPSCEMTAPHVHEPLSSVVDSRPKWERPR